MKVLHDPTPAALGARLLVFVSYVLNFVSALDGVVLLAAAIA
jgi:hypothetical protein